MDSNDVIKAMFGIIVDCITDDSNDIRELNRLHRLLDYLNMLVQNE